ncbi:3-hydroxyacyl-CoA dehydrogenase NAD-binding domain-containing protein [Aquisalimonas lutea]|uniref:3-hydroxyacyl-CoA dehydrogenase NAD-binding domain-containing protein n=1 Tax=Aquisalimonas lutea TaxID=1327750 RepID=UPI0025B3A035|nr:3-hydroxyacyl-CoA dehydrogenase NAD-binding domain-containing protein [Aquisalimonas lutea]MDN3519343.1 3-hydroxyacyl-CoA dehydrogenase NAD-binding domain-containing protein [Aquisalimonas lutea]
MTQHAEASCRVEFDYNGIAWMWLDCPDGPTNTLPMSVLDDLHRVMDQVEGHAGLHGLVIGSAKNAGFVSGASNQELARMHDLDHVERLMERGHALTQRIARLPVPSVAMIHGHCLGSGLELALACRYRVADRAVGTSLGLPDVRLGLHPCHGATARLPSVIGAWRALDLLMSGRSIDAEGAARIGLVDRTAPRADLEEAARDVIWWDPGRHRPSIATRLLRLAPVRWLIYQIHNSRLQREARPENFPATYAILRLWRNAAGRRMDGRLRAERESLLRLISKPSALNLVRTFLLQDRLKREARALDVTVPQRVHVFGAGTIGAGVAALLTLHGREVVVHEPDANAADAARQRAGRLFGQRLGEGEPADAAQQRLTFAGADDMPADAAFVIEAIPEDVSAKRSLYQRLEQALPAESVIASTTATLPVEVLAEGLVRPEQLIGLHFFHTVERMPLVEVVAGDRTSTAALQLGHALVAAMDKLPLQVRSGPGFLVNRLQLPYILKGAEKYERARREIIDTAALRFGMPIGPLELADSLGLDVCKNLAERLGYTVPAQLQEAVDAGRLGQWSGQGFHDWKHGRRVTASVPPGEHELGAIARELVDPMIREAVRCRDEGIVADDDLIDVAALFGAGFPAYTGGPLTLLRERGWGNPAAGR